MNEQWTKLVKRKVDSWEHCGLTRREIMERATALAMVPWIYEANTISADSHVRNLVPKLLETFPESEYYTHVASVKPMCFWSVADRATGFEVKGTYNFDGWALAGKWEILDSDDVVVRRLYSPASVADVMKPIFATAPTEVNEKFQIGYGRCAEFPLDPKMGQARVDSLPQYVDHREYEMERREKQFEDQLAKARIKDTVRQEVGQAMATMSREAIDAAIKSETEARIRAYEAGKQ